MKYQAYNEHKGSGVEWLGDIPETWYTMKFGLTNSSATLGGNFLASESEEGIPVIKMGNLGRGEIILKKIEYLPVSESYENEYILKNGDFLFNTRNSLDLVGKVAIWGEELESALYNSNILRITFYNKFVDSTSFMNYLFNSSLGLSQLRLIAKGTTSVAAIYYKELRSLVFAMPPVNEQKLIADFLDHETAKIDNLIEKQQQLIKLLKEKRQAVISHAVTKGLNPNAPMRDSGVEWLGEVPEHWEIKRFKNLFKIRKRISGELGYDILSITQKGIKIKDIESGEGQLSMDYSKYQIVNKGDYAMNHMDLLTGFVDISMYDGVTSPDYRVFTLEEQNSIPDYYLAFLQMGYINKLFFPFGQGAAHIGRWRLPTEAFNEFLAPCPPEQEQRDIASFIIKKLEQMLVLEEKAKAAIKLMQERRTALISATVTGKIDVRNWQPPHD